MASFSHRMTVFLNSNRQILAKVRKRYIRPQQKFTYSELALTEDPIQPCSSVHHLPVPIRSLQRKIISQFQNCFNAESDMLSIATGGASMITDISYRSYRTYRKIFYIFVEISRLTKPVKCTVAEPFLFYLWLPIVFLYAFLLSLLSKRDWLG